MTKKLEAKIVYSENMWIGTVMDVTDPNCHICLWASSSLGPNLVGQETVKALCRLQLQTHLEPSPTKRP